MIYPINEQEFIGKWLGTIRESDDGDRELAMAIAQEINRAYNAGMNEGRKALAPAQMKTINILSGGNSDSQMQYADRITEILKEVNQKAAKEIYYFVLGYTGKAV